MEDARGLLWLNLVCNLVSVTMHLTHSIKPSLGGSFGTNRWACALVQDMFGITVSRPPQTGLLARGVFGGVAKKEPLGSLIASLLHRQPG